MAAIGDNVEAALLGSGRKLGAHFQARCHVIFAGHDNDRAPAFRNQPIAASAPVEGRYAARNIFGPLTERGPSRGLNHPLVGGRRK